MSVTDLTAKITESYLPPLTNADRKPGALDLNSAHIANFNSQISELKGYYETHTVHRGGTVDVEIMLPIDWGKTPKSWAEEAEATIEQVWNGRFGNYNMKLGIFTPEDVTEHMRNQISWNSMTIFRRFNCGAPESTS